MSSSLRLTVASLAAAMKPEGAPKAEDEGGARGRRQRKQNERKELQEEKSK